MRETGFPAGHVAANLLALEVTVAVAVEPSEEVAGASQGTALVLSSLPRPASPSTPLPSGVQRLDDDVVQQFDATHRLLELTAAWGNLMTFATSFGEKLQVSFSKVLSSGVHLCFVLMPSFSLSFCLVFFSRSYQLLFLV